jgi:hypothetical protein
MISLLVLLVSLASTSAAAVECSAVQGGGGHWSYRYIDGKKCWYLGRAHKPKSELHWPAQVRPTEARSAPASPKVELVEEPELPEDWSPLDPNPSALLAWAHFGHTFDERFPAYYRGPPLVQGKAPPSPGNPWVLWLLPFIVGATYSGWRYFNRPDEIEPEVPCADGPPPWLNGARERWPLEEHQLDDAQILTKYGRP